MPHNLTPEDARKLGSCELNVLAPSHYPAWPDRTHCRCQEELWTTKDVKVLLPKLPALEYQRWAEREGKEAGAGAQALARKWGYYSWDASLLEDVAREWLYEAQEAGYLPHWPDLHLEVHYHLMERVTRLLSHTDDLEALRNCLSEALADMKRLRIWEHQEQHSGPISLAQAVEEDRMRPWLSGPQFRLVVRILREAKARQEMSAGKPEVKPPPRPPSRRQLEQRIVELEAQLSSLQEGAN